MSRRINSLFTLTQRFYHRDECRGLAVGLMVITFLGNSFLINKGFHWCICDALRWPCAFDYGDFLEAKAVCVTHPHQHNTYCIQNMLVCAWNVGILAGLFVSSRRLNERMVWVFERAEWDDVCLLHRRLIDWSTNNCNGSRSNHCRIYSLLDF